MKVVYFDRCLTKGGQHRDSFYLPSKNLILYKDRVKLADGTASLTDEQSFLDEARMIAEGEIPQVNGLRFSNLKLFEYDGSVIEALVENIRSRNELSTKIISGMEALLSQVK